VSRTAAIASFSVAIAIYFPFRQQQNSSTIHPKVLKQTNKEPSGENKENIGYVIVSGLPFRRLG
jgi:hypothetical protein